MCENPSSNLLCTVDIEHVWDTGTEIKKSTRSSFLIDWTTYLKVKPQRTPMAEVTPAVLARRRLEATSAE